MHCFYCENLKKGELSRYDFTEKESRHLFKVLRGKTGEKILLIDGKGKLAEAEIGKDNLITVFAVSSPPPPFVNLHLFVAPPRKQKMDQLLKQCSEIGIRSMTPLITERGISQPEKNSSFDRMRQHLLEGCKQSHNPYLPALNTAIDLKTAIEKISSMDCCFFGSTKEAAAPIPLFEKTDILNIGWIVGPEGGFTDQEEKLMLDSGILPLKIGQWVMRIETAAITGANLLISLP